MNKAIIALALILSAASAQADQACTALGNFVGTTYKLVSKTCDNPGLFGDTFTVEPYDNGSFAGYSLKSGSITIGPATSSNSTDKCMISSDTVTVQTCAFDQSCLPRGWFYTLNKDTVEFSANGCVAKYSVQ